MTTAERLTKVAENIPRVYEAGFNAGKAQGGEDVEYEFEDVSFLDLQEQGKLTIDNRIENGVLTVTENMLSAEYALFDIDISGYVEFEGVASMIATPVYISVDGVKIYTNGNDWNDTKFSFKGKVKENISIYASLCTYTFDRFAIGKVIRKDYEKGVADGKQAEYDRFWDNFQERGNRTDYQLSFGGAGWNNEVFKPKYDMRPVISNNMFGYSRITDLKDALEKAGVTLDFSKVTYGRFAQTFQGSQITRVGVIDTTGSNNVTTNYLFYNATKLREIEKWVITDDGKQQFGATNTFQDCSALEEIRIEGTLGCSLLFKWCTKLSAASLLSILTALSKDSTLASGKSITFATASQAVIEADAQCCEQYNLALAAGWQIKFE